MFINCVIFFYESNKSGDSYAAKERSRLEITDIEVQEIDLAGLKKVVR